MNDKPILQDLLEIQEHFGLPSPALVEKDWHVVRALAAITAADTAPPEQLATPTISPPADSYTSDQSVTISGPAGATIRYTTDGSTPNAGSPAYSDPIALTVPSVTTVKAYATKAGYADSAVASAAFTLSAAAQSEAYVTWTSGNNVTTSGSYVQCNGSAVHVHL